MKNFLLHFFYDISLNYQRCFRGKGAEVVIFQERNERYEMLRKCWVFQVLLAGIVHHLKRKKSTAAKICPGSQALFK